MSEWFPGEDGLLYTDRKTYLFVRTAKTASTTIIRSLADFNEEAPLGYWFNSKKKYSDMNTLIPRKPTSYKSWPPKTWPIGQALVPGLEHLGTRKTDPHHVPFVRIKNSFQDVIDPLFKFGFVRNPWERVVSQYFYYKDRTLKPLMSFRKYVQNIENWPERYLIQQSDFLGDCDFIGKVENFEDDLQFIGKSIGQNIRPSIQNASNWEKQAKLTDTDKKLKRQRALRKRRRILRAKKLKKLTHYSDYYAKDIKLIVANYFQKDIETFEYKFELRS